MIMHYKGVYSKLHESVFVAEGASIIGDVHIKEDSSVWFGAVVRGDVNYIRIGARTNVQDNCVLHVTKDTFPLIIGDDITIGHNVVLHGCVVKDRCLIGMGAIVLDDAEIGPDSIVGAGALVTEGTKAPPKSLLLGVPARVARELRDDEVKRILKSADNYIGYVRNYREYK